MIVEVCGFPGSGKSTFFAKAALQLQSGGLSAVHTTQIENMLWYRVVYKITNYLINIIIYRDKKLKDIIKNHSFEAHYAKSIKIQSYLKRLVYLKYAYKTLSKSSRIYLFDEGVLQVVVAIAVDYKLNNEEIQILCDYIDFESITLSIYHDASIPECIESIKKRGRAVCDIDRLNDIHLIKMLKEYDVVYRYLQGLLGNNLRVINRNEDINKKVQVIKESCVG